MFYTFWHQHISLSLPAGQVLDLTPSLHHSLQFSPRTRLHHSQPQVTVMVSHMSSVLCSFVYMLASALLYGK